MDISQKLNKIHQGFNNINVDNKYKIAALNNLKLWLTNTQYQDYQPQLTYLIENKNWDYLLDCFYQVIPFGTGGRRGEVGIGPNRINISTIQSSAQGHSQYLIKIHKDKAIKMGVVLAYGVRHYYSSDLFNNSIYNPINNLTGKDLAQAAASVYAANQIKVYIFDSPRTTPELSFAIRYLKAIAGDMFDASHNPPEHNGKKVFDLTGGQLIPPYDEDLVNEVTKNVKIIKTIDYKKAENEGLVKIIGGKIDKNYVNEVSKLSLSEKRNIKIVFTPLHGVGTTSVAKVLKKTGFKIKLDPKTSNQSGKFENVTFNIPNPEVIESFDTTLKYAKKVNSDIILNSDPDADRIGVMINHQGKWKYINGNEICSILVNYVYQKKKNKIKKPFAIKTTVTTNMVRSICQANGIELVGNLLVGFKYIGDVLNQYEIKGRINDFLLAMEESHGYLAGNYSRDKDAAIAGLWLAELAAELKEENKTLLDYLNDIYCQYGYMRNYLTEIRLPGAEGMSKIQKIQSTMRKLKPKTFKRFEVENIEDCLKRLPIFSETDRVSKNVLIFHFKPFDNIVSAKITLRPSGTEPKIKFYIELGNNPCSINELNSIKENTEKVLKEIEKAFMDQCYKIIKVKFPKRGYLLFWQLPLKDKLKYFEIEKEIVLLKNIKNINERKLKLKKLLSFLGSNPIEKIDKAFIEKYGLPVKKYLKF